MGNGLRGLVVWTLLVSAGPALAQAPHEHEHGEHGHAATTADDEEGERTLTGEVVDVFCYLSHGEEGLGATHAGCAKKCIKSGLPVAIKVGDQLYLASMADHEAANAVLADYAGAQVTVHGDVMERDGQRFIAVSRVEPAE